MSVPLTSLADQCWLVRPYVVTSIPYILIHNWSLKLVSEDFTIQIVISCGHRRQRIFLKSQYTCSVQYQMSSTKLFVQLHNSSQ